MAPSLATDQKIITVPGGLSLQESGQNERDSATSSTVAPAKQHVTRGASRFHNILKHTSAEASRLKGIRIENCVGFAQVPIGLAGPLNIRGEKQKGTVFAPLATVEATLVASCSRGCKALMQSSGGAHAVALSESMSRAPIFLFKTVQDAVAFYKLVPSLEHDFRASAESTSRHARLRSLTPHIIGASVHVKFQYSCGDAAGQNMTTIATHKACEDFFKSGRAAAARVTGYHVEGQMSSDKKASWQGVKDGRGVEVIAWGVITDAAAKKVLGLSTSQLERAIAQGEQGAIRSGQFGSNINTSNIVAAMFIACGQDAASIFEAGFAHLTHQYDSESKDLTISMYFPCLPVGTVGGGTVYPTQKECLQLLNCYSEGRKWALAESIAAFALALDISTASAVANDTFAGAHERLARL